MKSFFMFLSLLSGSAIAQGPGAEATVQKYIQGYLNADSVAVAEAFHPVVHLYTVDEGKLTATSRQEWIASLDERRARGDIRTAESKIQVLDQTALSASVKVELVFPQYAFTDYLSLLLVEGQWTIVGKIYVVQ